MSCRGFLLDLWFVHHRHPALARLFDGTNWQGEGWCRALGRLETGGTAGDRLMRDDWQDIVPREGDESEAGWRMRAARILEPGKAAGRDMREALRLAARMHSPLPRDILGQACGLITVAEVFQRFLSAHPADGVGALEWAIEALDTTEAGQPNDAGFLLVRSAEAYLDAIALAVSRASVPAGSSGRG